MRKDQIEKIRSALVFLICAAILMAGICNLKNQRAVLINQLAPPISGQAGIIPLPIRIRNNRIESDPSGIVQGTGTAEDPYRIENQIMVGQKQDYIRIIDSNALIFIKNCSFRGESERTQVAISVQNSEFVIIENSTFRTFYRGIEILDSANIQIKTSNFTLCAWGVYLFNSKFVSVEDNSLGFNKEVAILLVSSAYNSILRNHLYYTTEYSPFDCSHDLRLETNSSHNRIYHNYFETAFDKRSPIYCSNDSANNTFYYEKRGNYYGYYNKQENARIIDGIYDTVFTINQAVDAVDLYPIAEPDRPDIIIFKELTLWEIWLWVAYSAFLVIGLLMKKKDGDFDFIRGFSSIFLCVVSITYFIKIQVLSPYFVAPLLICFLVRAMVSPKGRLSERFLDPIKELLYLSNLVVLIAIYYTITPAALICILAGIYLWATYKDYGKIFKDNDTTEDKEEKSQGDQTAKIAETADPTAKTAEAADSIEKKAKTADSLEKKAKTADLTAKTAEAADSIEKKAKTADSLEKKAKTANPNAKTAEAADSLEKKAKTADSLEKKAKTANPNAKTAEAADSIEKKAKTADSLEKTQKRKITRDTVPTPKNVSDNPPDDEKILAIRKQIETLKHTRCIMEYADFLEHLVMGVPGLKKSASQFEKINRIYLGPEAVEITKSKRFVILDPAYIEKIKKKGIKIAENNDGILDIQRSLKHIGCSRTELQLILAHLTEIKTCFEAEPNKYIFREALYASTPRPPEEISQILEYGTIKKEIEFQGPPITISKTILTFVEASDKTNRSPIYRTAFSGLWVSGTGKDKNILRIQIHPHTQGGIIVLETAGGKREEIQETLAEALQFVLSKLFRE